jgi:hypothetical protein
MLYTFRAVVYYIGLLITQLLHNYCTKINVSVLKCYNFCSKKLLILTAIKICLQISRSFLFPNMWEEPLSVITVRGTQVPNVYSVLCTENRVGTCVMMCGISLNPLARFVETLNQKSAGCM